MGVLTPLKSARASNEGFFFPEELAVKHRPALRYSQPTHGQKSYHTVIAGTSAGYFTLCDKVEGGDQQSFVFGIYSPLPHAALLLAYL